MTVHALEYAIAIEAAAARSDFSDLTRRRSSATPGPKHLLSPKMRTDSTGLKFCSISFSIAQFFPPRQYFFIALTNRTKCVILFIE